MVFPTSLSEIGCTKLVRAAMRVMLAFNLSLAAALENKAIVQQVRDSLDPQTKPCENFYPFTCGDWIANQSLETGEQSRYKSFSTAQDRVDDELLRCLRVLQPHRQTPLKRSWVRSTDCE